MANPMVDPAEQPPTEQQDEPAVVIEEPPGDAPPPTEEPPTEEPPADSSEEPPPAADFEPPVDTAEPPTSEPPPTEPPTDDAGTPPTPVLADDSFSTRANQPITLTVGDVLGNDTVTQPQTVAAAGNAANGTVVYDRANAVMTFTPAQNFVGEGGFDYTVGTESARVTVNVTAPPPDAVDDTAIIQGNRTVTISADLLVANDQALPGSEPRIGSVGSPEHGSVGLSRAGDVVFSPERNYVGDARFAYTLTDEFGGSDTASVLVRVIEAPPDAPAQPPVVNTQNAGISQSATVIGDNATINQTAIINQVVNNIIQNLPPTTIRVPASDDDGGDPGVAQGLDAPVQAYFAGTSARNGTELWGYDGGRVAELADISPGGPSSSPADMTAIGGRLLFSAADLAHGREPWVFDGDSARALGDLNPGTEGSDPAEFTLAGRTLYFSADDGSHGRELWSASAGSVRMVADLTDGPAGSDPAQLTAVNGALYFVADDGASGQELWRADSSGLLERVSDLNEGEASSAPDALTEVNGSLFFVADNGERGRELFELRPGAEQPVLHDLTPGAEGSFGGAGRGEPLAELGGRLHAVAGDTLWVHTGSGFERIADLGRGNVAETEVVGDRLYAAMADGLARYDASSGDVSFQPGVNASRLTAVGDELFFTRAEDDGAGRTLWRDDGDGASRVDLGDEAQPHDLQSLGDALAFSAGGRLGLADGGDARFLTAEGGDDYVPVNITSADADALML